MGCVSSKILTKSASFRDDWNRLSLRRKRHELDEIAITKNNDHFAALVHTANTVATRLKEGSPDQNQDPNKGNASPACANSDSVAAKETETALNDSIGPSRRFRTVEDFDVLVAANKSSDDNDQDTEKVPKRKAATKDLPALNVPSFEFSRAGSLREWLLLGGGQVSSPGSYATPKFGNFVAERADCDDVKADVFDPELVEHFERAMEQLTIEEDRILEGIVEGLESFGEESSSTGTSSGTKQVEIMTRSKLVNSNSGSSN